MHTSKALSRVEIKDADKGTVAAVFSTFDQIDSDGDVTVKGAFTDGAPVAISAYGHQSWKGELPVGKGAIRELSTEAVFEGRFFMDTQKGHDTFHVVKEMSAEDGPGQQWSYGLVDVKSEMGEHDGKRVRVLKSITVPEVSPVLLGAGVNTRTLSAKGLKQPNSEISTALRNAGRERWGNDMTYVWPEEYDLDESWAVFSISMDGEADRLVRVDFTREGDTLTLGDTESYVERTVGYAPKSHQFSEHAKSVLADVDALITRATEVMALRAQKGKGISTSSVDLLSALDGDLERLKALLGTPPPSPDDDDLAREFARFVALSNGVMQ
jgi:hypothetical protein